MRELFLSLPQNDDPGKNSQVKQVIHELCTKFLAGVWKNTTADTIKVKKITGGTSNLLFYAELPAQLQPTSSEPSRVLIRIHCSPDGQKKWLTESVVFGLLSENKIGPKLFGVFPEGRLEEFIPSRPLTTDEISHEVHSNEIARKLARIHKLSAPLEKNPNFINGLMDTWFDGYKKELKKNSREVQIDIPEKYRGFGVDYLTIESMAREIDYVKQTVQKSSSPVCFCHNDLQENNILLLDNTANSTSGKLSFIDFEFASYNYRGHDIANHLMEYVFNYTNENPPYYHVWEHLFPGNEHIRRFCREYLAESHEHVDEQQVDDLVNEVLPFIPVSLIVWAVWALYMGETSPIVFGYKPHAQDRFGLYFKYRHLLEKLSKQNSK